MTRASDVSIGRATALVLLIAACREGGPRPAAATQTSAAVAGMIAACGSDSLRPVVAAPAAGLWIGERVAPTTRVAALVGPRFSDGGSAQLTRRVETLELDAGRDSLRLVNDTASVRLELLPPFPGAAGSHVRGTDPAAVYALGPLVVLASYEPCASSVGEPRLRYLRRDARGVVTMDLMLRRGSADTGMTR